MLNGLLKHLSKEKQNKYQVFLIFSFVNPNLRISKPVIYIEIPFFKP